MKEENFVKDGTWYAIECMGAYEVYDVLCEKCSFDKMIKLYKLIKHKMEFVEDEPRLTVSCWETENRGDIR